MRRVGGALLIFGGVFVLLLVADLLLIAEVTWRPAAVLYTVPLALIGAAAITFGWKRFAETYK